MLASSAVRSANSAGAAFNVVIAIAA